MSVPVLTGGYIRAFHGIHDKFVRLEDYQAATKPKLPDGYRVDENGDLVDPSGLLVAWARNDGLLTMLAEPCDVPAVIIWLQRRAR